MSGRIFCSLGRKNYHALSKRSTRCCRPRRRDRLPHLRATGITDICATADASKVAQRMAAHTDARTTGLYDWRTDNVSLDEVERFGNFKVSAVFLMETMILFE